MPDVDRILEELLESRRMQEIASLSKSVYGDQPILQTGKQLRERAERGRHGSQDHPRPHMPHDGTGLTRLERNLPLAATGRRGRPAARPSFPVDPTQAQLTIDAARSPAPPAPSQGDAAIPDRYYQLRDLAGTYALPDSSSWRGALAYGTRTANRLFYEQALLMEDFEDDHPFEGTFFQYFPTYSAMTLNQLRGYFTWRTRVRHGDMPDAPVSFAFLYVYELLCGVGTTPGERGLADIQAFRQGFLSTREAHGSTFNSYLRRWTHDYAIYHGLPVTAPAGGQESLQEGTYVLLRAEEAALAQAGLSRKLSDGSRLGEEPTDEELIVALDACSSYRICGARLYKTNAEDVCAVTKDVFGALVLHCSKRRKTDFVEGVFGGPTVEPYTMFSSAVFFEPTPHEDAVVRVSPAVTYACRDGRWRRHVTCSATERSPELGSVMHAIDARLRQALDYPYPLKDRKVPAYVSRLVGRAIAARLAHRAEQGRRRVTIDLSQLGHIRAAAAVTQEALLTDEERAGKLANEGREGIPIGGRAASPHMVPDASPAIAKAPEAGTRSPTAPRPAPADAHHLAPSHGLTTTEAAVLRALVCEDPLPDTGGTMLSLVVDGINDKLFDLVGDAVIEFDQDAPQLVEDYLSDVREILQP